jgi:hypothetical protein
MLKTLTIELLKKFIEKIPEEWFQKIYLTITTITLYMIDSTTKIIIISITLSFMFLVIKYYKNKDKAKEKITEKGKQAVLNSFTETYIEYKFYEGKQDVKSRKNISYQTFYGNDKKDAVIFQKLPDDKYEYIYLLFLEFDIPLNRDDISVKYDLYNNKDFAIKTKHWGGKTLTNYVVFEIQLQNNSNLGDFKIWFELKNQ